MRAYLINNPVAPCVAAAASIGKAKTNALRALPILCRVQCDERRPKFTDLKIRRCPTLDRWARRHPNCTGLYETAEYWTRVTR